MNSGSESYALAVDGNNQREGSQLILANVDPDSDLQLWEVSFYRSQWNVGVVLINKHTGFMAAPESLDQGARVIQFHIDLSIDDRHAWQTNVAGEFHTIMALLSDEMCLNAEGDSWSAGTPIITWDWSQGQPNELWMLTPVVR
jgi:hypothetical protein